MADTPEVPEVDVHEAKSRIGQGAFFLDVRETNEFAEARIPGTTLIPMSEFSARYEEELPTDRQIVIHCRSGQRSATATAFLIQHGYDAVNVAGGLMAWVEEGLPVEGDEG